MNTNVVPPMCTLDDPTRRTVIAWLRWEIYTDEGLIRQMKSVASFAPVILLRKEEISAKKRVLRILEHTESTSIQKDSHGHQQKTRTSIPR